jgi:hypothetical protein
MNKPFTTRQYLQERNEIMGIKHEYNPKSFLDKSPADQLKALGFKSATKQQVLTADQDKAKRNKRFAEDNIVNAWAKWFKLQFPNVPYTIDKVAQHRSKIRGALDKAASYQRGNPDIFIQSPRGGFSGAYIEQKKDEEELFYKGTRFLKPGSDLRHIYQAMYHAALREQGYWVMFSVSLDASIKMTKRYMAGNPYPMQVFEYRYDGTKMRQLNGEKYFKPITI